MNRTFYTFAIFFTGLYILIAFFQSIIYFQLGARMYTQQSFAGWYLCVTLIYLTWSFIMLKYYHVRKYRFTVSVAIISIIASLCHFIIVYNMLVTRELSKYYLITYLIVLGTGILYGISLILSNAGERPWLKAVGSCLILLGLVLASSLIWMMIVPDVQVKVRVEKIHQWTSLIGSLGPVLFILNFLSEWVRAEKVDGKSQESSMAIMVSIAFLALISTVIFGQKFTSESLGALGYAMHREKILAQPFEARKYVNSQGETMPYRLMKPPDYDSTKKYPLVVCLHHGGTHGRDNVRQIDGSEPAQILSRNRTKYPAFLFVPQCPQGSYWGGVPNFPSIDSLVFETIHALEEEFNIDEKRRYVTGISGGGYGSWYFISTRPKMFAAAIPICGGGDPKLAQNIVDVPVWAFHGEKDLSVPVRLSRDMIEAIKNAGGDPRYTEFKGAGHNIWNEVSATPGLLDWLFAQKRD